MRDMPKGLPQAGDQGLDNTDTWGRKYWGGAMFCLLADIEIRKATSNRLGLQDAMRGVIAAGGNRRGRLVDRAHPGHRRQGGGRGCADASARRRWDQSRSTPDLEDYGAISDCDSQGGNLEFDDTAPLAAIRAAITTAPGK